LSVNPTLEQKDTDVNTRVVRLLRKMATLHDEPKSKVKLTIECK
jgi:hypothetical protein